MTSVMDSTTQLTSDDTDFTTETFDALIAPEVVRERAHEIVGTLYSNMGNCPRSSELKLVLFVDFPSDDVPLADELRKRLPRLPIEVASMDEITSKSIGENDLVVVDSLVLGTRGIHALRADMKFHLDKAKYCVLFSTPEQVIPEPISGPLTGKSTISGVVPQEVLLNEPSQRTNSLAVSSEPTQPESLRSKPNGKGCDGCIRKCCVENRERGKQALEDHRNGKIVSPYLKAAAAEADAPTPSLEDRLAVLTAKSQARKAASPQSRVSLS